MDPAAQVVVLLLLAADAAEERAAAELLLIKFIKIKTIRASVKLLLVFSAQANKRRSLYKEHILRINSVIGKGKIIEI
jgi:hypothetical protein